VTERLLTAAEVADLLQVTVAWVHQKARDGKIPAVRLEGDRYWRFDREDIDQWVKKQKRTC
jgi:excisionase family DNA binding protein